MQVKRCIAMLMLAVYLFAVGTPAYAALTCQCVAMEKQLQHHCCSHCDHDNSVTEGRVHFESPCCGDDHSTEVELYTVSSNDGERMVKRLVAMTIISPAMLAEPVVLLDYHAVFCGYLAYYDSLSVPEPHVSSCGLRAPPVLV